LEIDRPLIDRIGIGLIGPQGFKNALSPIRPAMITCPLSERSSYRLLWGSPAHAQEDIAKFSGMAQTVAPELCRPVSEPGIIQAVDRRLVRTGHVVI
jgi:hypothetical protein